MSKDETPSDTPDPAATSEESEAAERRLQLERMRQEIVQGSDTHSPEPQDDADDGLRPFFQTLVERKKHRKHQLKLVRDLLNDPVRFGLQTDTIPSSSTPEEIAERRAHLEYRRKLLSTLLEITEGELELLSMAEADPAASDAAGAVDSRAAVEVEKESTK